MADNVTTQTSTLATVPNATGIETRDQGSGIQRQVTTTLTVVHPNAQFTRPANTTAYVVGYEVSNSTTAGSVTAMSFAVANGSAVTQSKATLSVRRCRIKKSGTVLTNAQFRLHLYISDPTATSGNTAGDGAAMSVKDTTGFLEIGYLDVLSMIALNDCAIGFGVPVIGSEVNVVPTSGNIYGLLEARAAYTPASGEVFTIHLEAWQW